MSAHLQDVACLGGCIHVVVLRIHHHRIEAAPQLPQVAVMGPELVQGRIVLPDVQVVVAAGDLVARWGAAQQHMVVFGSLKGWRRALASSTTCLQGVQASRQDRSHGLYCPMLTLAHADKGRAAAPSRSMQSSSVRQRPQRQADTWQQANTCTEAASAKADQLGAVVLVEFERQGEVSSGGAAADCLPMFHIPQHLQDNNKYD